FPYLSGGAGRDVFQIGAAGSLSGSVDGGGADNWLDYSAFAIPVTVNFATSTADHITGSVTNVTNAIGGGGDDHLTGGRAGGILIGGFGNDTIHGGTGRSLLIGGAGGDTIVGGISGDIIIAGTTSFDADEGSLSAILAAWRVSNQDYPTRIAAIRAGV